MTNTSEPSATKGAEAQRDTEDLRAWQLATVARLVDERLDAEGIEVFEQRIGISLAPYRADDLTSEIIDAERANLRRVDMVKLLEVLLEVLKEQKGRNQ